MKERLYRLLQFIRFGKIAYHPCYCGGGKLDHDFEYKQDTIGDYGVVNGTYTECWLECCNCGEQEPATYADAPCYDDY
jgi:hypothetical protein